MVRDHADALRDEQKERRRRIGRLPLRVRSAPGEAPYGVLARLALRHGCSSVREFAEQLPVTPVRFVTEVERGRELDTLARLSGVPYAQLHAASIRVTENGIAFGDVIVSTTGLIHSVTAYGRVCVACLKADYADREGHNACRPFRRAWWDLAAITFCPTHKIPLLAFCPQCDSALGREQVVPHRCKCGFDLLKTQLQEASDDAIAPDQYLLGRLGVLGRTRHDVLDQMSIDAAHLAMLNLGRASLWGRRPPRARHNQRFVFEVRAKAMAVGLATFAEWPKQFEDLLDRLASAPTSSRAGVKSVYGRLYLWLNSGSSPDLHPLRDVLKEHALRNIPATSAGTIFGQARDGTSLTVVAAAAFCGISVERMRSMAVKAGVTNGSGPLREIPKTIAVHIKESLGASIDRAAARQLLGVSQSILERWTHAGFFRPVDSTSRRVHFDRRDLEQMLSRLLDRLPLVSSVPVGCADVVDAATMCKRSSHSIIDAILSDRITAVGRLRDAVGVRAALVCISDIDRLDFPEGAVPLSVVPGMLKMTRRAVYRLSDAGLIITHKTRFRTRSIRICSLEEVARFDRTYCTDASLARRLSPQTSAKHANAVLAAEGVLPIYQQAGLTVFERATAEPAIAAVWRRKKGGVLRIF